MKWTFPQMPNQRNKIAIVTGASAGIGYETALALAQKGAQVTLACRSEARGQDALDRIKAACPEGQIALTPGSLQPGVCPRVRPK